MCAPRVVGTAHAALLPCLNLCSAGASHQHRAALGLSQGLCDAEHPELAAAAGAVQPHAGTAPEASNVGGRDPAGKCSLLTDLTLKRYKI